MWNGNHERDPVGLNWWWGIDTPAPLNASGQRPADSPRDLGDIQFNAVALPIGIKPRNDDSVPGPGDGILDQMQVLEWYLEEYYEQGFRRFVFKLPGGNIYNQDFLITQWQLMPLWKQNFFKGIDPVIPGGPPPPVGGHWNRIKGRFPGAIFEVYIGFPIPAAPCSPCYKSNSVAGQLNEVASEASRTDDDEIFYRWLVACPGVPLAEDFNPYSQRHVNYVIDAIKPWADAGFSAFWLDAAEPNGFFVTDQRFYGRRLGFLEMSYMPYFRQRGVRLVGETFPTLTVTMQVPGSAPVNREYIDDCSVAYGAWFGLAQPATIYNQFLPPTPGVNPRTFKLISDGWSFNRATTEVHFAPVNPERHKLAPPGSIVEPDFSSEEVGEARRRGFVVSQYNCDDMRRCEYVKRWYSMGMIRVADFNGDGAVNAHDRIEFESTYQVSRSQIQAGLPVLRVFANGNITPFDTLIDQNDVDLFNLYFDVAKDATLDYHTADDR